MVTRRGYKRRVDNNCTSCCPPLECAQLNCIIEANDDGFAQAFGLGSGGFYTPVSYFVDIANFVDNTCDCDNFNNTFPLSGPTSEGFQPSGMSSVYGDFVGGVTLSSPSWFPPFGQYPLTNQYWEVILQNGNGLEFPIENPDYYISYRCPAASYTGCGSAVFNYYGYSNFVEFQPPSWITDGSIPPCCSQIPEHVIVRSPDGDPCNCACNTMDISENSGFVYVNITPTGSFAGFTPYEFVNYPVPQVTGFVRAWANPRYNIFLDGPGFVVWCCNGNLNIFYIGFGGDGILVGQIPGSHGSYSGTIYTGGFPNVLSPVGACTITFDPV